MNEKYNLVGVVEIKDAETGQVVYKTHNMIVETGRKIILESVFNGKQLTVNNFRKFYEVGATTSLTQPDDTYDATKQTNQTPLNSTGITVKEVNYKDELDANNLCMKLYLDINSGNSNDITGPITAIGTLYIDGDDTILFSRAAIDPVYMQTNRRYIVDYKIYF